MHEGILDGDHYISTWLASRISLKRIWYIQYNQKIQSLNTRHMRGWPLYLYLAGLQVARYFFLNINWNPDPNKRYLWYISRHIKGWHLYLYLAVLQDQPNAAFRWPDIIFDGRIEILTLTNLPLDLHEGILGGTSISVPGWPPGSASSGLPVARYFFWCKNWNPDPNKPTFRYISRHIMGWPLYLYLACHQDHPPAASRWPDIIFGARIQILTLTNLPLDIHKGILKVTFISVPGRPLGSASSGFQVARYYFWWKNWNPDPNKPSFRYT